MKILVCGGRDYRDRGNVRCTLSEIHEKTPITELIHGACPTGADHWAHEWGYDAGVKVTPFKADWDKLGKAAGPIRNKRMADYGADLCVAFPGNNGTKGMVKLAKEAGIKVMEIEE